MKPGFEKSEQFEKRKKDHIDLSLNQIVQASLKNDLQSVQLVHEALPNFNFSDIDTRVQVFSNSLEYPLLVSSMTAGHRDGMQINLKLAQFAESHGWMMGVGSQRRELHDDNAKQEWRNLRQVAPKLTILGNIGISQAIASQSDDIQKLVDGLQASAIFIHLNPLQEVLQMEGTPQFKDGLQAIERLVKEINVPILVKEVGCGISGATAKRLESVGVKAIDVAGLGGTHWGRIEGQRAKSQNPNSLQAMASDTFSDWGLGTVQSLLQVKKSAASCQVWASGGVRTGLDAAKLLALGAKVVGFAQPLLQAVVAGEEALDQKMKLIEFELRAAMFCTGSQTLEDLNSEKVVT